MDADETSVESAHTGDGLAEDLRPFVALLRRQRMRNTQAQDGFAAAATEQGAGSCVEKGIGGGGGGGGITLQQHSFARHTVNF